MTIKVASPPRFSRTPSRIFVSVMLRLVSAPSMTTVRVNLLRTSREEALQKLLQHLASLSSPGTAPWRAVPHPLLPDVIEVEGRRNTPRGVLPDGTLRPRAVVTDY
jgi:hypothetical protein